MNMRKIKLKNRNYRSARYVSAFAAASLFAGSFAIAAVKQAPPKNLAAHPEVAGALAVLDAWIDGVQGYEGIPGISAGLVLDNAEQLARRNRAANKPDVQLACQRAQIVDVRCLARHMANRRIVWHWFSEARHRRHPDS
jgi:hypothetical protein